MLTAAGVEALLKVKEQKLADPDSLVMYTFRDPFWGNLYSRSVDT